MGIGVAGAGSVGLAFESIAGQYAAPTKYHPVLGESLEFMPGNQFRRPIRQSVDQIGVVPGNVNVQGAMSMECMEDVIVYYLYAMRMGIVKSGGSPNFVYTCTPTSVAALPTRTLSLTVVRNGQCFGYVGCLVSQLTLAIQNDILQMDVDIIGQNEADQAVPAPTWNTTAPFGPGLWNVQIPTASQVFDMDTFSYVINENGAAQFRLKNTGANSGRGAQFVAMGERSVQMTATRDFLDKTDYSSFRTGTAQSVTIIGQKGANNLIQIFMGNVIRTVMQIPQSAQGDILRASLTYDTTIDGSGNATVLTVNTQENIT